MPRYVILRHEPPAGSRLHWDLMLEAGDVLRTWALEEELAPGRTIPAQALADHRKAYLDYEGPVSRGRGLVSRWDCGTYHERESGGSQVTILLKGHRLHGLLTLVCSDEASQRWSIEFEPE